MALVLFSYRSSNTIMHRIPAALKLLAMMCYCFVVFCGKQNISGGLQEFMESLGLQLYCFVFALMCWILSGHRISSFRSVLFALIVGVFVTVFKMISIPFDHTVMVNGALSGLLYTIRFIQATFVCQIVFETTSSLEIKQALPGTVGFFIGLAITFIPLVFDTWQKVSLAAKARTPGKPENRFFGIYVRLTALISCMVNCAETTRKAILNRS